MDPLRPGLNLRPRLLAAGLSERELRRLRRTGELATVRPGAYVPAPDEPADADARHLLAVRAAVAQLGPGAVISHASAAVVHGLPLWADLAHFAPVAGRIRGTAARR